MRYLWTVLALAALAAVEAPAREPTTDDARRLAARIDEQIAAGYSRNNVKPVPVAGDAAFLRRASIDITGKIPNVNDVRRFLSEPSPEKRARAIERLLDSPAYANNFTNQWLELLIPEANSDFQSRYLIPSMHRWLRQQFANNRPY